MGKVLVIKGVSRYNVLRKAADLVAAGFVEKGYEVVMCDLTNEEQNRACTHMLFNLELFDEYDFVFSMQACLFGLNNDSVSIVSYKGTSWIGWIFDDMIYHIQKVKDVCYSSSYLFSVDGSLKRYTEYMGLTSDNINGMWHGGFLPDKEPAKKTIDILFPGTIGSKVTWENINVSPMQIEEFLANETMKEIIQNPRYSVRMALKKVLEDNGEIMTPQVLVELENVIRYVDINIRYYFRYELLMKLLEKGYTVHIVGENYGGILEKYSEQIVYHKATDIDDTVAIMSESRIVINAFPIIFEEGFHERIFTAMLCKAACFTPYSDYVREKLGDRLEYIDMNDLDGMLNRIKEVLSNYEEYSKNVLEDNYAFALNGHTWEKRGIQIADFFEAKQNNEYFHDEKKMC